MLDTAFLSICDEWDFGSNKREFDLICQGNKKISNLDSAVNMISVKIPSDRLLSVFEINEIISKNNIGIIRRQALIDTLSMLDNELSYSEMNELYEITDECNLRKHLESSYEVINEEYDIDYDVIARCIVRELGIVITDKIPFIDKVFLNTPIAPMFPELLDESSVCRIGGEYIELWK